MNQRERLLGRRLPPTPVVIRMVFTPEADAAHRRHDAALRALLDGQARSADPAALLALQEQVDDARAVLAPFVETLNVHVIPPDRYERLIGEHPPTEAQSANGDQWNSATFVAALLAECVVLDGDERMSAEDWTAWMTSSGLAMGELNVLFSACMDANDRSPSVHVGKGSGVTRS